MPPNPSDPSFNDARRTVNAAIAGLGRFRGLRGRSGAGGSVTVSYEGGQALQAQLQGFFARVGKRWEADANRIIQEYAKGNFPKRSGDLIRSTGAKYTPPLQFEYGIGIYYAQWVPAASTALAARRLQSLMRNALVKAFRAESF